ncbi:hypothetical protein ACFL0C_00575 [Patescibacteria group bacterium]
MKTAFTAKLMIYNKAGEPVKTVEETEVSVDHSTDEDPFDNALKKAQDFFNIEGRTEPNFGQHYTVDMYIKR